MGRVALPISYFLGRRSSKLRAGELVAGAFVVAVFVEAGFFPPCRPPSPWISAPAGLLFVPVAFVEEPAPVATPPILFSASPARPPTRPPAVRASIPPRASLFGSDF